MAALGVAIPQASSLATRKKLHRNSRAPILKRTFREAADPLVWY
jgi:hypothetical protein